MINLKKIIIEMIIVLVVGGVLFGTAKAFLGNWEMVYSAPLNGYDLPKEYSGLLISEKDPTQYQPFDFCFKDTTTIQAFSVTDNSKNSGVTRRFSVFKCR
ncbi:hypothetical protein ACU5EH_20635 [Aliivibrio salmonicida]|uniref:hypothetical protein n=1 Tax=Aliivibrio salmonicida TaxID=40269 RepID=UPI00406BE1EC